MECKKCGQSMKLHDGCVMGAYGVDIENCRDPIYKCKCGYVVEIGEEPPPSSSNRE